MSALPAFPAPASHHSAAKLHRLNAEYVEAFLKSDVDWYQRHLAEDFRCILANGAVIDRAAFLVDTAQPAGVKSFEVDDVNIQFEGDTAIIQARTRCERADGTRQNTRYTDIWVGRDGRWQALSAQITAIDE